MGLLAALLDKDNMAIVLVVEPFAMAVVVRASVLVALLAPTAELSRELTLVLSRKVLAVPALVNSLAKGPMVAQLLVIVIMSTMLKQEAVHATVAKT
jgi:hypothetical protein